VSGPSQDRLGPANEPASELPTGWRTSRRASRAGKKARKEVKSHERKEKITTSWSRFARKARNLAHVAGMGLAIVAGVVLALVLVATAINGIARWNAKRAEDAANSPEAMAERARENLLFIAETDGSATGFLAVRHDSEQEMVYGIAIPDAAFLEVPGQGFERIGDSYQSGADVSMAAVTNFFGVPFTTYGVVDTEIYQAALTSQTLVGIMDQVGDTNLSDEDRDRWSGALDETPTENVALVPLPVKPISLGSQTYFEPQSEEVADLVEQWWGTSISDGDAVVRVIVYNGSGTPGIAGEAAQQLIRGGFRVVDTKNADRFDYEATQVIVQNGDENAGTSVRDVLGIGEIVMQPADQQVADVIVIIGADYENAEDSSADN